MATYRQIHVSFWQDPFVIGLTPEEKYFYLYLMTNSKTTQCGIYELPKRIIEFETGYNRETVDKFLMRFVQYRKIDYYDPTQEIIILNWIKHNSINSPKVKSCIEKELKSIKYREFKGLFYHLCIQYGYRIDSLSIDSGEEKEKEEEQEEEKEARSDVENPHKKRLRILANECRLKGLGIDGLETIYSYIGQADVEVIEKAVKKAEGKSVNYFVTVMNGFIEDGKTRKESIQPYPVISGNKEKRYDPELEARRREIALNKHISSGGDPSDFVYPAPGA